MSELRIESVVIENVKGVASLSFKPGQVTVISGANGVGKSSVLDAIENVFAGGHDPSLIRHGADKAKVVLGLSDGTIIERTITEKDSYLAVKTRDGGQKKGPATYVKALASGMSFDPLAFIEAKQKERLAFLLEAMPITFARQELFEVMKDRAPFEDINLGRLNEILDGLMESRRTVNVELRQLDGTIERLEKALPDGEEGQNWKEIIANAEAAISTHRQELTEARRTIDQDAEKLKQRARDDAQAKIDQIRADLQAQIESFESEAHNVYEEGAVAINQQIETLSGELATARERASQQERATVLRQELAQNRQQASEKAGASDDLTALIEGIRGLKTAKLSELPIPGVDIREGEVYVNDISWPQVNTSEQYLVAAQLAAMAVKKLPFMILDRAEQLDDERFQQFVAAFRESGLQIAVARVSDGELAVQGA